MSDILIGNKLAWSKSQDFVDILNYLGGEEPSEQEIWDEARKSCTPPYIVNIWYSQVLSRIEYMLVENFEVGNERIDCFVNSIDTHLYIDKKEIYTENCILEFLAQEIINETNI